jgi:hypothetical protein
MNDEKPIIEGAKMWTIAVQLDVKKVDGKLGIVVDAVFDPKTEKNLTKRLSADELVRLEEILEPLARA